MPPPGGGENARRHEDFAQRALRGVGAVELVLAFVHARADAPEFLAAALFVAEGHGVAHALYAVGNVGVNLPELPAVRHSVAAQPGHQPGQQEGRGQVERRQHGHQRRIDRVAPCQYRGGHQDGGHGGRDGVGVEGLDALAVGHHAAYGIAGLQLGGAGGGEGQHAVEEAVAERGQDVEGDIVAGVLLDIRRHADDRAGYGDPFHLVEDGVPGDGAGFRAP